MRIRKTSHNKTTVDSISHLHGQETPPSYNREIENKLENFKNTGDELFSNEDYSNALEAYKRAEKLAYDTDNHILLSIIQASVANAYTKLNQYAHADAYYNKATETLIRKKTENLKVFQREKLYHLPTRGILIISIGVCVLAILCLALLFQFSFTTHQPFYLPFSILIVVGFLLYAYFIRWLSNDEFS